MQKLQNYPGTDQMPPWLYCMIGRNTHIYLTQCRSSHNMHTIPPVKALINVCMQVVLPAPLGPRAIMPCRTVWVSYSWIIFSFHGGWLIRPASSTCWSKITIQAPAVLSVSTRNGDTVWIYIVMTESNIQRRITTCCLSSALWVPQSLSLDPSQMVNDAILIPLGAISWGV